ncbi:DUF58 domain-containing protein [Streptomyces sp. DSM 44917]|uniref:DUF58 domain-containing protein n=1 Tax=Streptomyces boetiae TaxID=3075541 RepID=A0ABU2LC58_9ACTN|nr:DUF58 domain-containing protein [Streptomyces sp. DSM 44917]MDT0309168.1 DUF58 domain-containing protein [Streptomyces sp. DSM 44917]
MRAAFSGLTTRGRSFLAAGGAAAVCSYLLGKADLLRVGVLLAALPVLCVLVLHSTRSRVTAARRLAPDRIEPGAEARVHLRLENVARVPSGMLLLQDRVPYVLGPRPRFVLDRVEPGGRREVTYRIRSDVRGRYPVGPLQLRLADPFGMVELSRSFHDVDVMTVLPRTEPLPGVPLPGSAHGQGDGRRRKPAVAGDDDVIPRDYRHGDDLRRVHWRATARRGTLMVRREEQPRRARCTVLLDTRRTGYALGGPYSPFERAVSGAASAVAHLSARGYAVRLLSEAGPLAPGAEAAAGDSSAAMPMMDALAGVVPSYVPGFEGALDALGGDTGLVIAFLGLVDDGQVAVLARLRQRAAGGMAFLAAGQVSPALEAAREEAVRRAGWSAVPLTPGVPLGRLWEQAAAGRGTR